MYPWITPVLLNLASITVPLPYDATFLYRYSHVIFHDHNFNEIVISLVISQIDHVISQIGHVISQIDHVISQIG